MNRTTSAVGRTLVVVAAVTVAALSGCQTAPRPVDTRGAIRGIQVAPPSRGGIVGYLMGERAKEVYGEPPGYHPETRYPHAEPYTYGYVISPFSPHYLIDVRGMPFGAKVVDPSTGHVFINPEQKLPPQAR